MVVCFFGLTGYIPTTSLENRKTAKTKWYAEICLLKILNEFRKNNTNHRNILHYDFHAARERIDYLKDKNIKLTSHFPYSPDFWLNDFFFSPYV